MVQHRVFWAGVALVAIYSLQFVAARYSLQENITPTGLTVIRFFAAGALFVPYILFGSGFSKAKELGFVRILILTLLAGYPYLMVINAGIALTSAAYVATIGPGSIVLFSFFLSGIILKNKLEAASLISTALIIFGILLFLYNTLFVDGLSSFGAMLFVLQGFMFSMYGVLIKRWNVDPVMGTAVVALMSCIPALVPAFSGQLNLEAATTQEIVIQVVIQGFLAGAASVFLYNYLVQNLGPQRTSLFMPSVPIITTVAGYFFLNELLTSMQALGLIMMALGMATPGALEILRSHKVNI